MKNLILAVALAVAVAVFGSVSVLAGPDNAAPYIGHVDPLGEGGSYIPKADGPGEGGSYVPKVAMAETDDSSSTTSDSSSGGSVATGSISG